MEKINREFIFIKVKLLYNEIFLKILILINIIF